jgi:hypothetical protein
VLVRGENNRNMIAQIDTMWTGQERYITVVSKLIFLGSFLLV